jgi:anti-sigma B factor antagonist
VFVQSAPEECVTLFVEGEIDLATGPTLERKLRRAEAQSPQRIVLDLTDLEFMDVAGLRVLSDAQQRAAQNGHQLLLSQVPPRIQRLFDLSGFGATRLAE